MKQLKLASLLLALLNISFLQAVEKPNIVIIYVDDLGYGDVSCNGATAVQTLYIDKLANNGINFTDAHCCGHLYAFALFTTNGQFCLSCQSRHP